jgi:hypothetical protein
MDDALIHRASEGMDVAAHRAGCQLEAHLQVIACGADDRGDRPAVPFGARLSGRGGAQEAAGRSGRNAESAVGRSRRGGLAASGLP